MPTCPTRRFLRSVCRALIGALLFAQMAIAAYACPALASAGGAGGEATMTMPDCAGMADATDPSLSNLCAEHCHYGQQSDQASTLNVPLTFLTLRYATPPAPEPLGASPAARPATSDTAAAVAPPHAILHCCLRI